MRRRGYITLFISTLMYILWMKFGLTFTSNILGEYAVILYSVATGSIYLVWIEFSYLVYDKINVWANIRRIKKTETVNCNHSNFYVWLSNVEFEERYFYDILGGFPVNDLMTNLKTSKEKIENKIGSDIANYYLLRNWLEYIKTEISSFSSLVKNLILPITATFITGFIIKILDLPILEIFPFHSLTGPNIIALVFIAVLFMMGIIRAIKSLFKLTTLKERRINALLVVINAIISEMEHKKVQGD